MTQRDSSVRVAALVVVSDQDGRILLVRSARRSERWELPGGRVEASESPMEAAEREVLEETGVGIADIEFVGLYFGSSDGLLRITFRARARDVETRTAYKYADEILETGWFSPEELPRPVPVLARRMIAASASHTTELATVEDDSEML